jgi:hypothetical protein
VTLCFLFPFFGFLVFVVVVVESYARYCHFDSHEMFILPLPLGNPNKREALQIYNLRGRLVRVS